MLPAGLLILDEIRNLILYSNPTRARKVEHERKKTERRISYKIKGMRLAALILIRGLIFSGIVACNLGNNEHVTLKWGNKVDNSRFISQVFVLTPDNSEQQFAIHPWYGIVSPANETHITAPYSTPAQISSAPYILPVFWIIALAGINPYLPAVAEIIIYTSIVILILLPFWYKKSFRGRHKRRISFKRRFAQLKRTLHV